MTTFQMQAAPDFSGPLTHGFLLVEPATLVHAPELAALDMRPCTPRVLAHRDELMPRLIDLAALDDEARAVVTECWVTEPHVERPPVICAWLESEADGDAISEHIARYLVGPGSEGEPVFWRYYDPRVFVLTFSTFDPTQREALLGPIKAWQFAWAGYRWTVTGAGVGVGDTDPDRKIGWPRPQQWLCINRSQIADRVLRRLPAITVEQTARLPVTLEQVFSEVALSSDVEDVDVLVEFISQRVRNDLALEAKMQG